VLEGLGFEEYAHFSDERSIRPDLEQYLLGTNGTSRRKAWGLARFLGHSHPITSFGNYIHFLGTWADELVATPLGSPPTAPLKYCYSIEVIPSDEKWPQQLSKSQQCGSSPDQLLRFFRLLARGHRMETAAKGTGLSMSIAQNALALVSAISKKGKLSRTTSDSGQLRDRHPLELIQRIKSPAWKRLLGFASSLSLSPSWAPVVKNVPTAEFEVMLSDRWQLVLWNEHHFALARLLVDQLAIFGDETDYRIVGVTNMSQEFLLAAEKCDFQVEPIDLATGRGAPKQLAAASIGQGKIRVAERCAVVFLENATHQVRNSVEFFLMAIALWCSEPPEK
jgi:hypothetical protein